MLLEITLALLIGILAGTITGLFPGIHINLIAAILLSSLSLPLFTSLPLFPLVIFIVSMAVTHTFLDFIPSIYLGAPEEDSFLSVLPGHNLLLKGQGHKAVMLTLYGSLISLIVIVLFIPIFIFLIPQLQTIITPILPFILIFASFYLIFRESAFLTALTVFLLAGFLGIITLNYLPIRSPLLPLLTGLFGLSTLLISLKNKTSIPKQSISPFSFPLTKSQILKSSISAALTAPFASFLPGFGSGQAAVISSELSNTDESSSPQQFLFLVGMINTIVMGLSFITIFSIQRIRTGAASAVLQILKTISSLQLTMIISTIFISGTLAFFLGIKISKIFASNITKISYKYLSIFIITVLIIINMILSNPLGLLVLAASSALGIFCILSNVKRINLMGALILPTIIFYLTI
tara:strand:+ start:693 stop:1913 length:1221 start_codon:yes stop_codon:yes gene_type:complete